ncbi:DnaJ subfamily B member 2 [Bonamia ostreae]|uniref:DnaJ subfamily B member 2 n=1 Tax=Bonamia ostreae TaxID=126728 RepID=A0ABV2ART8_9EUKA
MANTEPDFESKDFYKILGVERNATNKEIKKAYRYLALKWHPDKNPKNRRMAELNFRKISEAFQVLGDHKKKRQYDRGGLENINFGNHFHSADDIFRKFFGTDNPFSSMFEDLGFGSGFEMGGFGSEFSSEDDLKSGKSFYSSSTTRKIINGEETVEKTINKNGKLTKEVYVNGQLTRKMIDGVEQNLLEIKGD